MDTLTSTPHPKETSLTTSVNREGMLGSWFSTGFYGHSRAKGRMDLCDFYRQLARPIPPRKFLDRQKSEATTHQFSRHDNRFKLESDPIIRATESGFGRRKSSINRRGNFDPLFLSWSSMKSDDANDSDETTSKSSFASVVQTMPTIESSIYVRDYHHGQPNSEQAKEIRQETFQRYSSTQSRRSRLQQDETSPNVASCLVWSEYSKIAKRPSTTSKETSLHTLDTEPMPKIEPRASFQSQSMINLTSATPSTRLPPIAPSEPLRLNKMQELVSKYL